MNSFLAVSSYGRSAGSARVRLFDWLEHLRIAGTTSTYLDLPANSMGELLRHPGKLMHAEAVLRREVGRVGHHTVFLSRQATPFSRGRIEARLLRNAEHGVYDFDDALMHAPSRLGGLVSQRATWERSVKSADIVIAGNEYLAEAASNFNGQVVVIPSCVNPDTYLPKTDYQLHHPPMAVWLGSPSTERYLVDIAAPLLALHRRTGLRLTVISRGRSPLGELDAMIDRKDWSLSSFGRDLADADVGLMPLPDTPWSRGKCAYKLLQYGATGLPMVGSAVGANVAVLRNGDGLAVVRPEDWDDAIHSILSESPERRAARGRAARNCVADGYSFGAWEDTWRSATGV